MDIVFLRDLRIDTVIGIYGWERRTRQTLIFDLEMSADIARAAASDDISDTLNYKSVAKRLIEFVGQSEYQLVETLADDPPALLLTVDSGINCVAGVARARELIAEG
mgnify:CR=1 FL=1